MENPRGYNAPDVPSSPSEDLNRPKLKLTHGPLSIVRPEPGTLSDYQSHSFRASSKASIAPLFFNLCLADSKKAVALVVII